MVTQLKFSYPHAFIDSNVHTDFVAHTVFCKSPRPLAFSGTPTHLYGILFFTISIYFFFYLNTFLNRNTDFI